MCMSILWDVSIRELRHIRIIQSLMPFLVIGICRIWSALMAYGNSTSVLMCEYAHSMGNSLGGLVEYWSVIRNNPCMLGGFIWDWLDQGLEEKDAEENLYWGYGGDYERPQDCGNRTGVRWLTAAKKGRGVKFVSDENYLNVSLWPFSEATLESAMHINELPLDTNATVNINHKIAGVGGIDSWSSHAAPIEAYRLLENEYEYSFVIVPVR